MATLRPRLTMEEAPRDLKGALSLLVLCLLISTWIHLVGFIIWEKTAGPTLDRFHFVLEAEKPTLELTLIMGQDIEEPVLDDQPGPADETVVEETVVEEPLAVEAPPEPTEAAATPEETLPLALTEGPVAVDEELARTELLPPAEAHEPANPSPPVVVEAEAPKFKSYYTLVRSAVARRWIMPPEARTNFRPGCFTADFTIGRDGTLLRIVVIASSGSATLDHAALEALRSAAPFPPFPEELQQFSQLDIRMNFDYQAQYIRRQN